MLTNFVALTASLAATASAFDCSGRYFSFTNRGGSAMSYQRIDPSVWPGETSPHMHTFDGGNGLGAMTTFEDTQNSKCSTARIKSDKSLYWRPTLYYKSGDEFTRVQEKNTKIYYRYGDGSNWANVTGFPEGFNMIAGEPTKRSEGDNPSGMRWGCHQPDGSDGPAIITPGFPKGFQSCKYGFAAEVTFPSCWNGQPTDPKNAHAHMAYPSMNAGIGIENCPTTHRAARFPTILLEFWWDISEFDGKYDANSVPWVLSNGDPTGYGFHADFLNGWEKGVLEKATQDTGGCTCGCGCGQAEMEQCFGSENVNKDEDAEFKECSAGIGANSDEAAPVLTKLPGCNPLQYGPASATPVSGPGCTAAPVAGGDKAPTESETPVVSSTPTSSAKKTSMTEVSSSSSSAAVEADYSLALPQKEVVKPTPAAEYGAMPVGGSAPSNDVKPTATAGAGKPDTPADAELPSLSLATTASGSKPTDMPAGGDKSDNDDAECKAPVTVTVTPTVTVTLGQETTSCDLGTVTKTMTEMTTVTVTA